MNYKFWVLIFVCPVIALSAWAQQDTTRAKTATSFPDSAVVKPVQLKTAKPAPMALDTSSEYRNWERLYYGASDEDQYDTTPWDEFLFQDSDSRAGVDERDDQGTQGVDDRDTQRDNRE